MRSDDRKATHLQKVDRANVNHGVSNMDHKNRFSELTNKGKEIGEQKELSFLELFPDEFIAQYTDFQTLQQMFDASGLENPEDLDGEVWSQFVASHSHFKGGWAEMMQIAYAQWYGRNLET